MPPTRTTLRPYQLQAVIEIRQHAALGGKGAILQLATGAGKCLGRGTPVMMFDGTARAVEEINSGDLLLGPDSAPRRVLSTCRGVDPMYEIQPVKGAPWVCNGPHILNLVNSRTGEKTNITIDDYLSSGKNFKHLHKLHRVAATWFELPHEFSPYALGVYLAEGSSGATKITNPDPEILEEIKRWADDNKMFVLDTPGRGCRELSFRSKIRGWFKNHATKMRDHCIDPVTKDRFVPYEYLSTSRKVRLEVLAGLLDGDGHLENNCYEIITKYASLRDGVLFLARSLGLAAYSSEKLGGIKALDFSGIYHRILISGNTDMIPCRVARKKATPRKQIKDALRTGFTVTPIGNGEYFGFELDGDGLFLLGDFTVTHNTAVFCNILQGAYNKGRTGLMVVRGKSLVHQASERLQREGIPHGIYQGTNTKNTHERILVCSVDTLFKRKSAPQADIVVVDECQNSHSDGYRWLFEQYPNVFKLGVSATPHSKDGMRHIGDKLVRTATITELIRDGYLVGARYFVPYTPNLKGIKTTAGDYNGRELSQRTSDDTELTASAAKVWSANLRGKSTLVYGTSVGHATILADALRGVGACCEIIVADTPDGVRRDYIGRLESGEIDALVSVGVLTTGVDIPSLRAILCCRPTNSYCLWIQIIGRATRPFPGKTHFEMYDLSGNLHKHGPIEAELIADLDSQPTPDIRIITCLHCYAAFTTEQAITCDTGKHRNCPACFGLIPASAPKNRTLQAAGLAENDEVVEHQVEAWELELPTLVVKAKEKGLRKGWVYHTLRGKFGETVANSAWPRIRNLKKWAVKNAASQETAPALMPQWSKLS